ncbi:LysM peptidoglycan-binding domain-containing protein [Brevibacterium oceani]|jgi:hypothetical protein|uniref:LysM peptidoglycan-binding domain-containing protein n=1 Tax=Brevibacterium oceani TaxID=358099 RepID=UPI001B32129F|nr:LysM domain-containing protein [Brevibacterium oceani]
MYRLIACAVCWLVLLGSFLTAWASIPRPWSATDLIVLAVVGAAAVAFARLGLVSVAALLLRILPSGRIRALLARAVIRVMPRLLTSSVLAVASTAVVVQAANAAPAMSMESTDAANPTGAEPAAAAPVDPGWPTSAERPSTPGPPDSASGADEVPTDDKVRDPGWPTDPPAHENEDDHGEGTGDDEAGSEAGSRPGDSPEQTQQRVHDVDDGESLWSIAEEIADSPAEVPELVQDIYTANRDTIGPDPSLIIAGQRLEIQQ